MEPLFREFDQRIEKYTEILSFYQLNLDSVRQYLDTYAKKDSTEIPFKHNIPHEVVRQKLKDSKMNLPELVVWGQYLDALVNSMGRRRPERLTYPKIHFLKYAVEIGSHQLDFIGDSCVNQDFLDEYVSILNEYSDYKCKIKYSQGFERSVLYSKFLKDGLLLLMIIEYSILTQEIRRVRSKGEILRLLLEVCFPETRSEKVQVHQPWRHLDQQSEK